MMLTVSPYVAPDVRPRGQDDLPPDDLSHTPRPVRRAVLLALCCAALAGCGGAGGADEPPEAPAGVRLAATYRFPGPRSVDARLRAEAVVDPVRDLAVEVPAPAGRRFVEVVLTWTDRGRDPLPWDALRFTLTDAAGRRIPERFRVPPQTIRAGNGVRLRGGVAFAVPDGSRAGRLHVGSIITGAPLRATLALPQPSS
jgi:hypothetical protein